MQGAEEVHHMVAKHLKEYLKEELEVEETEMVEVLVQQHNLVQLIQAAEVAVVEKEAHLVQVDQV
jgi:hypothetical protein